MAYKDHKKKVLKMANNIIFLVYKLVWSAFLPVTSYIATDVQLKKIGNAGAQAVKRHLPINNICRQWFVKMVDGTMPHILCKFVDQVLIQMSYFKIRMDLYQFYALTLNLCPVFAMTSWIESISCLKIEFKFASFTKRKCKI